MYSFTITAYIKNLNNLKAILEKAKAWQLSQKISDEAIMDARLALDQFTFAKQVRSVTYFAKSTAAELCGVEAPAFEDNEKNLTELQTRIDVVVAYLSTLTPEMVKTDLEVRLVPLAWMKGKGMTAKYFIEEYAHANFYFHYTTAYAVLRHYGLQIGKGDFIRDIQFKDLA
jgi:hypothetical protein